MTRILLLAAVALAAVPAIASAQAVPPSRTARDVSNPIAIGAAVTDGAADVIGAGARANTGLARMGEAIAEGVGNTHPYASQAGQFDDALKASKGVAKGAQMVGRVAAPVELVADGVSAVSSCSNGDIGNCVVDSLDVAADVAGMSPHPVARTASIVYTGGKIAGKIADETYTWARGGKTLGEDLYDVTHPNEDAKIWAEAERQQGAMKARADSAYQASSSALQAKQGQYDAEQAEMQRQQMAAQQQAAQSAQSQALMSNLMSGIQGQLPISPSLRAPGLAAPLAAPASPTGACHPGHDEQAHPGGCHQGNGTAR